MLMIVIDVCAQVHLKSCLHVLSSWVIKFQTLWAVWRVIHTYDELLRTKKLHGH